MATFQQAAAAAMQSTTDVMKSSGMLFGTATTQENGPKSDAEAPR
jgi:hypothetical protein